MWPAQILGQSGDRGRVPGMRGSALPSPAGQDGSSGVDWSNRCAPAPPLTASARCRLDGRSCGWRGLRLAGLGRPGKTWSRSTAAQAEVRGRPEGAPAGPPPAWAALLLSAWLALRKLPCLLGIPRPCQLVTLPLVPARAPLGWQCPAAPLARRGES